MSDDMHQLAEDVRALMAATADVAGDQVGDLRKRLTAALDGRKDLLGRARTKAAEGVKAADEAIYEHPHQAIVISVGVGAVLGYLLSRRCDCKPA